MFSLFRKGKKPAEAAPAPHGAAAPVAAPAAAPQPRRPRGTHGQDQHDGERQAGERGARRQDAACPVPARKLAPDRHARRLRHQPVRRLRRPSRRPCGQIVHDARAHPAMVPGSRPSRAWPRAASCTRCRRPSAQHHGLQCGFCTPGMIMAAVDIVARRGGRPRARTFGPRAISKATSAAARAITTSSPPCLPGPPNVHARAPPDRKPPNKLNKGSPLTGAGLRQLAPTLREKTP